MKYLLNGVRGCLYGGAIGDAIGSPTEGRSPAEIRQRYGEVGGFLDGWDGPSTVGKGDGRYTDDTLMVECLCRIYIELGGHLDIDSFATRIVAAIADEPRWIAEHGREMLLLERLFYPEKWLYLRLRLANVDPRIGGIGNMVNCGAAMYAAPVGIINAADPRAAYREAIEIFAAHQSSYGLEAAGVMAGCVAEALRPEASADSVVSVALELARDGTRAGIAAVVDAVRGFRDVGDWRRAITVIRNAIRPHDGANENIVDFGNGSDDWQPSRRRCIEELPVALGMVLLNDGEFASSVLASANYGRDADSIAGMAGAIAGSLGGVGAIDPEWLARIDAANRSDLGALARQITAVTVATQRRDLDTAQRRGADFASMAEPPA